MFLLSRVREAWDATGDNTGGRRRTSHADGHRDEARIVPRQRAQSRRSDSNHKAFRVSNCISHTFRDGASKSVVRRCRLWLDLRVIMLEKPLHRCEVVYIGQSISVLMIMI